MEFQWPAILGDVFECNAKWPRCKRFLHSVRISATTATATGTAVEAICSFEGQAGRTTVGTQQRHLLSEPFGRCRGLMDYDVSLASGKSMRRKRQPPHWGQWCIGAGSSLAESPAADSSMALAGSNKRRLNSNLASRCLLANSP